MSELLPKPNAEEIKAYRDAHECGIDQAKHALHNEWVKRNLLAIADELKKAKGAHPMFATPQLVDAVSKLVELILNEAESL